MSQTFIHTACAIRQACYRLLGDDGTGVLGEIPRTRYSDSQAEGHTRDKSFLQHFPWIDSFRVLCDLLSSSDGAANDSFWQKTFSVLAARHLTGPVLAHLIIQRRFTEAFGLPDLDQSQAVRLVSHLYRHTNTADVSDSLWQQALELLASHVNGGSELNQSITLLLVSSAWVRDRQKAFGVLHLLEGKLGLLSVYQRLIWGRELLFSGHADEIPQALSSIKPENVINPNHLFGAGMLWITTLHVGNAHLFLNYLHQADAYYFIRPIHPPARLFWMGMLCHYAGLPEHTAHFFSAAREQLGHYNLWRHRVAYVLRDDWRGRLHIPAFLWDSESIHGQKTQPIRRSSHVR